MVSHHCLIWRRRFLRQAWNLTGDTSIKEPGGKTWISEMYGFCFAAAAAGVWHRQIDYAANLVPGNGPIGALLDFCGLYQRTPVLVDAPQLMQQLRQITMK